MRRPRRFAPGDLAVFSLPSTTLRSREFQFCVVLRHRPGHEAESYDIITPHHGKTWIQGDALMPLEDLGWDP